MKVFTKDIPEVKNVYQSIQTMVSDGTLGATESLDLFKLIDDAILAAYNLGKEERKDSSPNYVRPYLTCMTGPELQVPSFVVKPVPQRKKNC